MVRHKFLKIRVFGLDGNDNDRAIPIETVSFYWVVWKEVFAFWHP